MASGKRWSNGARASALLFALLLLAGCGGTRAETGAPDGPAEGAGRTFYAHVNGTVLEIAAAANPPRTRSSPFWGPGT